MAISTVLWRLVPFLITSTLFFVRYPTYPTESSEELIYVFFKCAPMICLTGFVYSLIQHDKKTTFAKRVFVALCLSTIGDAAICLDKSFVSGALSFGVAQSIYIHSLGLSPLKLWIALPVYSVEAWALYNLWPALEGNPMRFILPCYMGLLFTMIWRSLTKFTVRRDLPSLLSAIGAILFGTSDIILTFSEFLYEYKYACFWIMSTYYYAQAGLALSVVTKDVLKSLKKRTE